MRRWLLLGLAVAACTPVPVAPTPTAHTGTAVVRGELPKPGSWVVQAVSLQTVVLVQAEIGGPGLATPITAQAALEPDFHFAVPFAAVPLGENRPVTIIGYGIDGRPVPGIVLQGWLTITGDGFRGQASAASTPVGGTLRRLWDLSVTDPLAGIIARQIDADALQTYVTTMNRQFSQDYSLMDGVRIADAILGANRDRTAFDIATNGVRLPAANGSVIRHGGTVRGTLYGLQDGDTLRTLNVDDPLSPSFSPLPTVNGTPFLFYPVVPGSRHLAGTYGPTGNTALQLTYSRACTVSDDTDSPMDLTLPTVLPRQVPPGGTVLVTGNGFGSEMGSVLLTTQPTATTLTVGLWNDSTVKITLPGAIPAGPAPMQVSGRSWQLNVQPLQILAGPPRIDSATIASRTLRLAGSNFSAYAGDHRLSLMGSDRVAVPVPVTLNGAMLEGAVPAGISGPMEVHLAIGDVEAQPIPSVTF